MLAMSVEEIGGRADGFVKAFAGRMPGGSDLSIEIIDGVSAVGGGAAPQFQPATRLLALSHSKYSAVDLEQMLRNSNPPIISRIVDGKVMLDLRTVGETEEARLLDAVVQMATRSSEQNHS
jgi:L-seryl-tRNA(Ser) seleniumtransferase